MTGDPGDHVVTINPDGFTVAHPPLDHPGEADCPLQEHIASLPGPRLRAGRYRVWYDQWWRWEALRG